MKKIFSVLSITLLLIGFSASANAYSSDVFAYANSLWYTPLNTGIDLTAGDLLTMSAAEDDTWSAGGGDRTSNANGLRPGNPYGGDYGYYDYNGFSFYYGSLVGRIGSGDYFFVGTQYEQVVSDTGLLYLMYWDSNYSDNYGDIMVSVNIDVGSAVPEPSAMLLLGTGLIGLASLRRRMKR